MFNLIAFLNSNSDKLSDQARSEVRRIKNEHDKQMAQKGIISQTQKEKSS